MKATRLFSYAASFLIIPILLLSLTGCENQEDGDETLENGETTNEATAPVAGGSDGHPVLNPEGTAGPSTARVIFPNGNELIEAGKSYDITWDAKGFNKVNIELEEEGYSRGVIAKEVLASVRKYTWTPLFTDGTEDGHTMNLQIVLSDAATGEVLDKSDKTFVITKYEPQEEEL